MGVEKVVVHLLPTRGYLAANALTNAQIDVTPTHPYRS